MYLSVAQQLLEGMQFVRLFVINFFDAGVDQYLETVNAWRMRNVNRAVFYARAVFCRLSDGVHFSMNGPEAVLLGVAIGGFGFVDQTTDIGTMGHTSWGTVITRGEDVLIAHDYCADLRAGAG